MTQAILVYILSSVFVWGLAALSGRGDLAWFDLWCGVFVDRKKRIVYICPLPCFLIMIELATEQDKQPDVQI